MLHTTFCKILDVFFSPGSLKILLFRFFHSILSSPPIQSSHIAAHTKPDSSGDFCAHSGNVNEKSKDLMQSDGFLGLTSH